MPRSQAEVRWAHAVLEGTIKGDRDYAQEVVSKMHGRSLSSLPQHVKSRVRAKIPKRKRKGA
jgi:hypothetical protein